MVEIIRLAAEAERPSLADDQPWLYIDQSADGHFYGSGGSWKATGEWIGYGSLPQDDIDLDRALSAACIWAARHQVPTIWVFISDEDWSPDPP